MILDAKNKFAAAQADVRAAATYLCGKSIDLRHARGSQMGDPPDFYVRVGTAFADGTSVAFQLVCADNEELTTNLQVLATSGAIVDASLTANTIVWKGKLPQKIPRSFLGMQAVGVGTHTAGDFDAGLSERVPLDKTF